MRSAWFKSLGLAAVVGWMAVTGSVTGCQAERAPINRVQANAVRKVDLVGDDFRDASKATEWYMRNTIIGVQRTNPYFSDGLQDILRRVRFEIQENYLIVRDAYEFINGADGHGGPTGKTNNGAVVAMYPISSHFDVKQGYNPTTGENTNIYEENSSDRRWFEREYMRIDWSQNLVNDPNFFEIWYPKAFGQLKAQPVQYFEENPSSPTVSNFKELGEGYMDVTSRWLLQPATFNYYGFNIPQCLLMNLELNPGMHGDGSVECNDQEVVIRTSMMKVPTGEKSTDYEVREVDGQQEQIVGGFYQQRFGYDREYGVTDKTWHWNLIRYNIWKKSHTDIDCATDGAPKADADAFCGAKSDANSTCDLNAKKCTLPFSKREVNPIAFYVDHDLPGPLLGSTQRAVEDWNQALRMSVAVARESECRRIGVPRDECHAKQFEVHNDPANPDVPNSSIPAAAVMCHNPVIAADPAPCEHDKKADDGSPYVWRKGDIRHHMIAWWPNPSFEAPLGVVVLGHDPLTGEHVSSMANVFGDGMEKAVSLYRDWIQLANGDVTPSEYADGVPEQLYGNGASPLPTDPIRDPALDSMLQQWGRKQVGQGMTKAEIDARMRAVDPSKTVSRLGLATAVEGAATIEEKMERVKAYIQRMGAAGTPGFGGFAESQSKLDQQSQRLIDSGMESQIVNDQWVSSFGLDPKSASSPTVMNAISPLRSFSPALVDQIDADWQAHWEKYHACKYPSNVWKIAYGHFDGIAAKYRARYKDGDTASGPVAKMASVEGQTIDRRVRGKMIYWELFNTVYTQVLEHEMGHNFSLDHDFGASWDSVNYFPQYWTMRAHGQKMTDPSNQACPSDKPRGKNDPDTCMGPRYLDPETSDELGTTPGNEHDQISSYGVSSFMDYHEDSRYWGPSGLGAYDKMAAKFIYGDSVELFDDTEKSLIPDVKTTSQNLKGTLESMLGGDWRFYFVGLRTGGAIDSAFAQPIHYTELARRLNLFDPKRCRASTPEEDANGVAQYHLTCAPVAKDHALLRDMVTEDARENPKDKKSSIAHVGYWRTKDGYEGCTGYDGDSGCKVRWPYKYGPSHFANYPHIAVFDQGADTYEVTSDIINWHTLHNAVGFYRAHDREWNPTNAQWHIYRSYYKRMHLLAWDAINSAVRYQTFFPGTNIANNPIAVSDDWGRGGVLSMTMLFDVLQDELLRPQPGGYGSPVTPIGAAHPVFGVPTAGGGKDFQLGVLDASYIDNDYDTTKGYWYQSYVKRLGHWVEKPLAAIGLTDSRPPLSIVSRETYLDGRNVMFSFRSAMPQAIDRLFAGAFADDWDSVAPYVVPGEPTEGGMSPLHSLKLWSFDGSGVVRPAGARIVDPMLGYRAKVPALILSLLYQPIDSNMEMVHRTRVWVEGGPEGIKIPDDRKISFYDPAEGTVWSAIKLGTETIDGRTVQIGIGARMIQHANDLLAASYNVKVDATGQVVYGADHKPVVDPASTETTLVVKDANAAAELHKHVGFLNVTRQLLWHLGFGPLGRGEED